MLKIKIVSGLIILVCIALSLPAFASDLSDKVEFHGFGSWGYGDTDGNQYLIGTKDGEYSNFNFSLAVAAEPAEDLTISAQASWSEWQGESKTEMDYAFAEWFFIDALQLRAGKVKQPFGIYNEVYNVGTIRPFFTLPQGIYGGSGFRNDAYKGIGLTGSYYTDSDWGIDYDIYGGQLETIARLNVHLYVYLPMLAQLAQAGEAAGDSAQTQITEYEVTSYMQETLHEVFGGNVTFHTPIDLSVGFSSYTGVNKQAFGEFVELILESGLFTDYPGTQTPRQTVYNVYLQYIYDFLSLRGEFFTGTLEDYAEAQAAYAEVAVKFLKHWEAAARYDWLDFKWEFLQDDEYPSLSEHKEWAVGLNYWFNTDFVLKLSYHVIDGNYYALPQDITELVGSDLDKETQLILFGAQFSF